MARQAGCCSTPSGAAARGGAVARLPVRRAVAAFGLVLRDSEYRGTATLDQALELAGVPKGGMPMASGPSSCVWWSRRGHCRGWRGRKAVCRVLSHHR